MMYTKRIVTYGDNSKLLVADFSDVKFDVLSIILTSEAQMFYNDIAHCLDVVLSGEEERHEFAGNACLIIATPTETTVECTIDDAEIGESCTIDTAELRNLLQSWKRDLDEFRSRVAQ